MAKDSKITDLPKGPETFLDRYVGRYFQKFIQTEASGGILLIIATVIALVWVNSPFGDTYNSFWGTKVNIYVGETEIFANHTLTSFVNDALMALFFFVVGLEIKRELVDGQLKNPRNAALPAIAAIGGMVIPAAIYYLINMGGDGAHGWGIPMATDIAFAVGVVSLLGDKVNPKLKVFLLSLAIVDDIGAIIVIALFYSGGIKFGWLAASAAILAIVVALRFARVWYIPLYILLGVVCWWTTYRSGVHATIAGVLLGLLTPALPIQTSENANKIAQWVRDKPEVTPTTVRYAGHQLHESVSVAERIEHALHPITSYVIIPIFAMANAGVKIDGEIFSAAMASKVTWGIVAGLLIGKTVGITAFSLLAKASGIATMPQGLTMQRLVGLSLISGIGFTVSLFVASLAFPGGGGHAADFVGGVADKVPELLAFAPAGGGSVMQDNAKIGILIASAIASVGGLAVLATAKDPIDADTASASAATGTDSDAASDGSQVEPA